MTQPLGEPLFSVKAELLFNLRCLAHILGGYSITVIAAVLSSQREVMGMLGIMVAVIALWIAHYIAAWLVSLFDEPILQVLATSFMAAIPFGILCGPLIRAVHPDHLLSILGGIALLLTAAGLAGLTLPVGMYRFVPWWIGTTLLLLANLLTTTADTGVPVIAAYLCVLILAVCTAADANRAVSDLRMNQHQASRLSALVWLDAINLVRQLRPRTFKI